MALLAGCTSNTTPDTAASANTSVSASTEPSTDASPSVEPSTPAASPTGGGCQMSGKATGGSGVPLQFMKAWLSCDTDTLHSVLSDAAYTQVTRIGVPHLDMTWKLTVCEGAAGSTYCTYRNKLGSDLILRLRNDLTTHSIIEVKLDPTVFHTDPEKYAREFLDAFVNHNKPRLLALSSQAVVDSVVVPAPPPGYDLTLSPEPHWVYSAHFTSTGEYWIVTIHGPLGKAHGVTAFGNAG
ncbi:hypothetical protein [Micromonospora globispora]|uniref:hypothetical protein n=1 Tax=Micromonospora globispora TaxID=1450148 RepID=UPI000F4F7C6B|nr:hypothetical protein [Micromonospora globispora]